MDKKLGEVAREASKTSLKEARSEAGLRPGQAHDSEGKGGVSRTHVFDLDYTDKNRGLRWQGHFRTRVLSVRDQMTVGRVLVSLRGSVPPVALDPQTAALTEMLAHLTVCLDEAPPWARGDALLEIFDLGLIGAIYAEVREHEGRFWGTDGGSTSQSDGGEL